MDNIPSTPSTLGSETSLPFRTAFEALRERISKVDKSDQLVINLDIPSSTVAVLGRGPEIKKYRPEIVRQLPEFDIETFDQLDNFAMAAAYAHTRYLIASKPAQPIQELVDELTKARDLMVGDVTQLAKRNLVDGSRLKELIGPNGFKNLAFDIMLLTGLLRENWSAIQGKTGVQAADLDRAEGTADRLALAVGLREEEPSVASGPSEVRQSAYTLFVNAYDEVRRALTYTRWHKEDVDTIAPSLYAGKNTTKKKVDPPAPEQGAPGAPAVTAPGTPVGAPTATTPIAPIVPTPRVADTTARATPPAGMPGNEPFGN